MDPVNPRSSEAAYRRKKQIEEILYSNLLHMPYSSISISELCRQAGISRVAFYHYYRDKDDCLCSMIDHIIQSTLYTLTAQLPVNATPLEAATMLMEAWRERKIFWDIVVQNNLLQHVLFSSINSVLNEDRTILNLLNTPELPSDTDILCCYLSSQITLILQWHARDFDTPAQEMAKKYLRLTHVSMFPALEE